MDDPLIFRLLATGTLLVASVFIVGFLRDPWWRSQFGQSVMVMAIGLWLFALQTVLVQYLGPDYPHRQAVRIFAQSLIPLALTQRTWVLLHAQWRDRRRAR